MLRAVLAAFLVTLSGCRAEAQTIDAALSAYSQNRVAQAEAILARIAADPAATANDRASAWRESARIAWLIDGNGERAFEALGRAQAAGGDPCATAVLTARILHESGRSQRALDEADGLIGRCSAQDADGIRLESAEAALDLAAGTPAAAAGPLERAASLLAAAGEDARRGLQGSAVALQLALLRSDAAAASAAWKDYFWLAESDVPQAMRGRYPAVAPLFAAGLARDAAPEARLQLVDLLVRAGFATTAERFAAATELARLAPDHALWRKASGYFDARRALEGTILASNRRVARGGRAADLGDAVRGTMARLVAAADVTGDPIQGLREVYGLFGTVGDTGGFASVHLGHIVQDERRTIEQYGHRAEIGFIAIDNMISNGFESWLWDGTAAAGGWTSAGPVIVQVRPGYTSGPLGGWSLFHGGPARERLTARQAERAGADNAALAATDVAFLSGLSDRLRLQVAQQIGARAQAIAGRDDPRRAFLDEYWRATFQQSILSHEGRHALDRTLVRGLSRLNDSNLEYRAKLSELALSDYPRLALLNINDRTIGGGTPHGRANEQILRAYVRWMGANAAAIPGFDPAAPALAQIDKLTDDQIRAVARGLDPIAG